MARFTLRKTGGGSTLRGGDALRSGAAGGDTYTGSGAIVLPALTASGAGTYADLALETWHQLAGTAGRQGANSVTPLTPWRLLWTHNGPDADGGIGDHYADAPAEGYPVAGNGRLYLPQGSRGLLCLDLATGAPLWRYPWAEVVAAPAYDPTTDTILFTDTRGLLWRLPADDGDWDLKASYWAGSAIRKAPAIVGAYAYVVSEDGALHKVTIATMAQAWKYVGGASAGKRAETPPAYATAAGKVVYATGDGYVHAVTDSTGVVSWRVKPGSQTWGAMPWSFDGGWPVIAEQAGLVLLRTAYEQNDLLKNPNGNNVQGPTGTPSAVSDAWRAWFVADANRQTVFAMNLTDGSAPFVPGLGHGLVEWTISGTLKVSVVPSMPVVKVWPNGDEVAYVQARHGDIDADTHWDATIAEMVLTSALATRLSVDLGDWRFVKMGAKYSGGTGYAFLIDEECALTLCGDSLLHAHWGATEGVLLTDRADARGFTKADPIATSNLPSIIRSKAAAGTRNPATHYVTDSGTYLDTARSWATPAYWTYWGVESPPGSPRGVGTYSAGIRPRVAFAHKQYLVVHGDGGDVLVFRHSGTVVGVAAPAAPTALTLTGPVEGKAASASEEFTLAFAPAESILASGSVVCTLSDGAAGGTFKNLAGTTITTISLTQTNPEQRFTYTPEAADAGTTVTISVTNNGGLTNP